MVSVLQLLKDFQERTRVIRKKLAPNQTKKDYIEIKGLLRTERDWLEPKRTSTERKGRLRALKD